MPLPPVPKITVVALVSALVLAGCGDNTEQHQSNDPCAIVTNGTPVTKAGSAAQEPREISAAPEVATGYRSNMKAIRTKQFAVATANPLATQAACRVLEQGGTAADAIVAAQAVLGLVEPQSSGLGGGGFLVYYDAAAGSVQAYDGREVAPAAATENYLRWISDTDRVEPQPDTRASGRSIGVPGIIRMLADAHSEHGRTSWRDLFSPAIALADQGFPISPRLAAAIADSAPQLARDRNASNYFLNPDGSPKAVKALLTNPAYAKTLGIIATDPESFYTGDIAADIVEAAADASGGRTPSVITAQDLANYKAIKRDPLCTPYRGKELCGMPPPSSGGIAVAATLGILEHFNLAEHRPTDIDLNGGRPSVMGVHLISEAERLAYADRDRYVADPDFVPLPGGSPETLLASEYLAGRAKLISLDHSMGTAKPGEFGPTAAPVPQPPEHGTSHISVIDKQGNAASLTTTIESAFGSFHMVDGFLLNNQLTDFSAEPTGSDGVAVVNRVGPGKRPRSSMAPTLIFDRTREGERRQLYAVAGSPGGSTIIQYVIKTLVGVLDWGLDAQQAVSAVDFGAANGPKTNVGGEHPAINIADNGDHDPLVIGLRNLGHQVDIGEQSSGLSALVRSPDGWIGGADPRREGVVMGGTQSAH